MFKCISSLLFFSFSVLAADTPYLEKKLKTQLEKIFLGARIELVEPALFQGELKVLDGDSVEILKVDVLGRVSFLVNRTPGSTRVAAWLPALVAQKRVIPGEKLSKDTFKLQEVNVAQGLARELKGIILAPETDLSKLEARQTILESQFVTSAAVQRIPDVRRGDPVSVQMHSGSVVLSLPGIAQEPASLDGVIRVQTQRTKRELVGRLKSGGIVEVQL